MQPVAGAGEGRRSVCAAVCLRGLWLLKRVNAARAGAAACGGKKALRRGAHRRPGARRAGMSAVRVMRPGKQTVRRRERMMHPARPFRCAVRLLAQHRGRPLSRQRSFCHAVRAFRGPPPRPARGPSRRQPRSAAWAARHLWLCPARWPLRRSFPAVWAAGRRPASHRPAPCRPAVAPRSAALCGACGGAFCAAPLPTRHRRCAVR